MPKKNFLNNFLGSGWTSHDEKKRDKERRHNSGGSRPPREPKESKWREKSCPGYDGYCGETIKYNIDWENIPNYCPSCTQKAKKANRPVKEPRQSQPDMWREKQCPGGPGYTCYSIIRYRTDWSNIPTHCESCRNREWEKPCSTPGCGNTIRFKLHYRDVSDHCGHCKKMMELRASRSTCIDCGGLLWIPPGKNYKRCKNCSETNKRTKPCKNPRCSHQIEYYPNDEKQYDYCRDCSAWQEKPCARKKCRNVVRFKAMWEHQPNFCESCKAEMQSLNRKHQTTDPDYIMPGMGETIGQMGGIEGVHYPRQGKIHCVVFQGKGDEDLHFSWDFDATTGEVIGEVYMHVNNPRGRRN